MSGTTDVDGQDQGELTGSGDRPVLRFRRRLAHPPERVWSALVEPEQLEAWFPTTVEGERAAGARLRFSHRDVALPPMEGEMLTFEPHSLLEMLWGGDVLRFELKADGGGTLLLFTCTFEPIGKAARDGAGWHTCLDRLPYALDGSPAPWSSAERWRKVHAGYVERLGPEAATIGPPQEWERAHPGAGQHPS